MSPEAASIRYLTNRDLPDHVKYTLPYPAQDIYREAFNSAWKHTSNPTTPDDSDISHEEIVHRLAWSAVKKQYIKRGPAWVSRSESHLYRRAVFQNG